MSKLIKEFENGIEKRTLVFRKTELSYSMIPRECGSSGDAPCFIEQLGNSFEDISKNEELLDEVDCLDYETDEDEIFRILSLLNDIE